MTPESQIKALAELDGWHLRHKNAQGENWVKPNGDIVTLWYDSTLHGCNFFTHYLISYDAIIPLIQQQPEFASGMMNDRIDFTMTPSQLCEVLLRATGKWKE